MPVALNDRPQARHRLLRFVVGHVPPGRSPVSRRAPLSRRIVAERFRHTVWIERKPGAMWDAAAAAPRAVSAR